MCVREVRDPRVCVRERWGTWVRVRTSAGRTRTCRTIYVSVLILLYMAPAGRAPVDVNSLSAPIHAHIQAHIQAHTYNSYQIKRQNSREVEGFRVEGGTV